MIHVGLTGWGDHPNIYSTGSKSSEKLVDYSAHFPKKPQRELENTLTYRMMCFFT